MRRLSDERGSVSIMVALLVVALLGFTAIVVDVGALYSERRQLQNGADAAVLAIAQQCAAAVAVDCPASGGGYVASATATTMADANANDGLVDSALVSRTGASVTVATSGVVDHWFAPVLELVSSEEDYSDSTVGATAKAVWGSPSAGFAFLPIAFAECVFNLSGTEQWIRNDQGAPDCVPPMGTLPGSFQWLQTPDNDTCSTYVDSADPTTPGQPGNSFPGQCADELMAARNTTLLVPIYEEAGGTGSGVWYNIKGFAAFKLTGYMFASDNKWNNTGPPPNCTGNCRGIKGKFVEFVSLDDFELGGPPDFGTAVVKLVLP